jgi:hypothetical protein
MWCWRRLYKTKLLAWFYGAWINGVITPLAELRSRPQLAKAAPVTTPNFLF